jgi:biopolymer transport protein ExbB/TolQ
MTHTKRKNPVRWPWFAWTAAVLGVVLWAPSRLFQTKVFTPLTLVYALFLTWVSYFAYNQWAVSEIDTAFRTVRLSQFDGVSTPEQAADRAIELKWADPKLKSWLIEVLKPSACGSEQACELFRVSGEGGPRTEERLSVLRGEVVPKPPGVVQSGFWQPYPSPDAGKWYKDQESLRSDFWKRATDANASNKEEKRKFVRRFLEAFGNEMNASVRVARKPNSWPQWVTIAVTWVILVALGRRWLIVHKLNHSAYRAWAALLDKGEVKPTDIRPADSEISLLFQRSGASAATELDEVRETADKTFYGLLASLTSAIPALGFIGTVMGMGESLGKADGLFSSQEKQRVIGDITQGLGVAFDATFISLVCAAVVLVIQAVLRGSEQRMFHAWAALAVEARGKTVDLLPVASRVGR